MGRRARNLAVSFPASTCTGRFLASAHVHGVLPQSVWAVHTGKRASRTLYANGDSCRVAPWVLPCGARCRLDVTRFTPSQHHLKTLRRMEDFLSGRRPITRTPLPSHGGGARCAAQPVRTTMFPFRPV